MIVSPYCNTVIYFLLDDIWWLGRAGGRQRRAAWGYQGCQRRSLTSSSWRPYQTSASSPEIVSGKKFDIKNLFLTYLKLSVNHYLDKIFGKLRKNFALTHLKSLSNSNLRRLLPSGLKKILKKPWLNIYIRVFLVLFLNNSYVLWKIWCLVSITISGP